MSKSIPYSSLVGTVVPSGPVGSCLTQGKDGLVWSPCPGIAPIHYVEVPYYIQTGIEPHIAGVVTGLLMILAFFIGYWLGRRPIAG